MKRLLVCLLTIGCHKVASVTVEAGASSASSVSARATASSDPADAGSHTIAQSIFHRWNLAHNAHDAKALEPLYASEVDFYGTKLSNAECVKRKAAAFAKSPDYKQKVLIFSFNDYLGTTYASFQKKTIINGKEEIYVASISVKDGHIVAETDETTKENLKLAARTPEEAKTLWCLDSNGQPLDKVIPPFKISASKAVWSIASSKDFAETGAGVPNSVHMDRCPTECGTTPRSCGYDMIVQGFAAAGSEFIVVTRSYYVDAVTNMLWWESAGWKSEQLPPP